MEISELQFWWCLALAFGGGASVGWLCGVLWICERIDRAKTSLFSRIPKTVLVTNEYGNSIIVTAENHPHSAVTIPYLTTGVHPGILEGERCLRLELLPDGRFHKAVRREWGWKALDYYQETTPEKA